jgi:hypothetical protein
VEISLPNVALDAKGFLGIHGAISDDTARNCRTLATASELLSFKFKGWGECSETG